MANRTEWRAGMDPRDDDSDDDGVEDGDEGAGTISSYFPETTGLLTIDVFGDGQVTGLVTDETEISCDDGDDQGDEDGDDEGSDDGDDEDSDDDEVVSKSDDDPADDEGDSDDEDGDDGQECSTADLQVGAIVQEAELEIESGVGLVFEEIELIK